MSRITDRTILDIPLSPREWRAFWLSVALLAALIVVSAWIGRAVMGVGGWR